MHLEGLAKFERNKVLTEVPPVKDEKGEATEVQVLEEGDVYVGVFDPDEFLEKLEQFHTSMPAMSSSHEIWRSSADQWQHLEILPLSHKELGYQVLRDLFCQ